MAAWVDWTSTIRGEHLVVTLRYYTDATSDVPEATEDVELELGASQRAAKVSMVPTELAARAVTTAKLIDQAQTIRQAILRQWPARTQVTP